MLWYELDEFENVVQNERIDEIVVLWVILLIDDDEDE